MATVQELLNIKADSLKNNKRCTLERKPHGRVLTHTIIINAELLFRDSNNTNKGYLKSDTLFIIIEHYEIVPVSESRLPLRTD